MLLLTNNERSISHILATWFRRHEAWHQNRAPGMTCHYCDALDDLENYIQIREEIVRGKKLSLYWKTIIVLALLLVAEFVWLAPVYFYLIKGF